MMLISPEASSRYVPWSVLLKARWGRRVQKIPLDIGAGCPHRKRLDRGGCIFCDSLGGGSGAHLSGIPMEEQISRGFQRLKRRYKTDRAILYFQSYSTTNIPTGTLVGLIEKALAASAQCGTAVGLAVGARPDQVPLDLLDYLEDLSAREFETWLELGVQTTDPAGLKWLNRGHGLQEVEDALEKKRRRKGILSCGHLIAGIPDEDPNQLALSAEWLSRRGIDGLKFHPLYVLAGTPLERLYSRGAFLPLAAGDYASKVVEALRRTRPDVVIQRLSADAPPFRLVAPEWICEKANVIEMIENRLVDIDARQGDRWTGQDR